MISTKVTSACSKTRGQDSSAVEVFSKYCQLAELEEVTTTDSALSETTSSSSSIQSTSQPSPALTPARTTPSPTNTPSSQTSDPLPPQPEPEKNDNTAAIAAGVTVPVVLIALGLLGFLLYRHRQKHNPHAELAASAQVTEVSGAPTVYGKDTYGHAELEGGRPQELDPGSARGELAASPGASRDRKIERLLGNGSGP
ncbi:hypothetical protein DPSP01_010630 [Paraphaeosphaeria sporulosa]